MSDDDRPDETPEATSGTDAADGGVAVDEHPDGTATGGDGGPHDPAAPTGDAPRRRGWLWLLPWVLLVLALAAAAVSTWQLQELRAEEGVREDVERAAGTFMLTLTTWDGTQGMGETREELRAAGTDRFAGEVDELFGTTEDLAGLAEIGASSEGDIRRTYVQEVDGDQATALVIVAQRISSDLTEEVDASVRYAEVQLLERDGEWRIDEVELLIDAVQQEGEQTVSPEGEADTEPDVQPDADPEDDA